MRFFEQLLEESAKAYRILLLTTTWERIAAYKKLPRGTTGVRRTCTRSASRWL
jgi:hypothetical protein